MGERFSITVDGFNIVGEIDAPSEATHPQPALCICHGIPSGHPPDPADGGYPLLARRFVEQGFVTCIFNFRGAGESGGNLDMLGWTRDLKAVITHLTGLPNVDSSRVYLMGFSGGAAASVYVAAHDPRVSAVVLCACPADFSMLISTASLADIVAHHHRIGTIRDADFPPSVEAWGDHFVEVSPIGWIDRVSPRPILIIHGQEDDLVPVDHARRLHEKAADPKELLLIPGAGHRLRTDETLITASIAWLRHRSRL